MAKTPLWGTDASLSTTTYGAHFNAFDVQIAQGITSYFGFGDTWMTNHGTINSWSGNIAGFTTYGASNNALGISAFTRSGASTTLTWITGCTLAGTLILTGLNAAVTFLGTDTSAYSFVGTSSPTETWATS